MKSRLRSAASFVSALVIVCGGFAACVNMDSGTENNIYAEEDSVAAAMGKVLTLQIDNPVMQVNGTDTEIDPGNGTAPLIVSGRTLVPIRAIIENMGGSVEWKGEKRETILTYNGNEIRLTIDSKTAYLNDDARTLDVVPAIINERTMLPIRFIAEGFGFDVSWNEEDKIITVEETKTVTAETAESTEIPETNETVSDVTEETPQEDKEMKLFVGEKELSVQWEANKSVEALKELIKDEPLSIKMSMYGGFEQVGSLGTSLPRNDVQTVTEPGDIVLYSGNQIVIFYGSNSWAYTKLGKVINTSANDMKELLGNGDVTITLSMSQYE